MTSPLVPLRARHSFKTRTEFHNACATCESLQGETRCALACCRLFLVALSAEDRASGLVPLPPFVDLLNKRADGSCASLDETTQRCTNWAERPLECRTYDCREDTRNATANLVIQQRSFIRWPLEGVSTTCESCQTPLQLLGGCRADCDGHALCANCFAPYTFRFDYRQAIFELSPAPHVDKATRDRYALVALLYQERFSEAETALLSRADVRALTEDELRAKAICAIESGKTALALDSLDVIEAHGGAGPEDTAIDRAIAYLRANNGPAALEVLSTSIDRLPLPSQALAHYYCGRAYRLTGDAVAAATAFSHGVLAAMTAGVSLTVFKEQLFEMEQQSGAWHDAASDALALLEPLVPTLRT